MMRHPNELPAKRRRAPLKKAQLRRLLFPSSAWSVQVRRVERSSAPQSQSSAEDTPTGGQTEIASWRSVQVKRFGRPTGKPRSRISLSDHPRASVLQKRSARARPRTKFVSGFLSAHVNHDAFQKLPRASNCAVFLRAKFL